MKKKFLLFVFVCLTYLFIGSSIFAQTAQPKVYSPTTYWQNCPKPLMAIPSSGGTLNWYLTNLPTEIPSTTAPTPNTAIIGSAGTYYVSQTIGGVESSRVPIVVNVQADSGATILSFRCDASQIPTYTNDFTPPATINNTVLFDWANNNAFISQTYFCSYSIQGGPVVTEFNPNNESHFIVSNLSQGQSVELTLTSASHPCVPSQTITCSVPCTTFSTPTFDPIGPICAGETPPDLPSSSLEGIQGTWSPAVIDNTTSRDYLFTPNANECANDRTITVVVDPNSPGFSDFDICMGSGSTTLSNVSPNSVTGTWSPTNIVDDMNNDSYTFTPDSGQCSAPQTIAVTVIPSNTLVDFSWTVTEAFAENQKITISAEEAGGDYLYQLDEGPFQSSPVFEYVASGTHAVTVIDQTGCSMPITKTGILVVNYPKFFTPNNDGYNDNWNITELSSQSSSYIRIFDRYGKFLKQISPNTNGWNGTYNGQIMPADDYWFIIHYNENNIIKEFKSHFALKR
jgi:gliding motility-associated-like protein